MYNEHNDIMRARNIYPRIGNGNTIVNEKISRWGKYLQSKCDTIDINGRNS